MHLHVSIYWKTLLLRTHAPCISMHSIYKPSGHREAGNALLTASLGTIGPKPVVGARTREVMDLKGALCLWSFLCVLLLGLMHVPPALLLLPLAQSIDDKVGFLPEHDH